MSGKVDPALEDVLLEERARIFASLNAIQIGKISEVQRDKQTVTVELQMKRILDDGRSIPYPPLVDVPFFVLQGGGAFIQMPVKAGDYCIVLFNDRCIDGWFPSGAVQEPACRRMHSLSDGIAIVGLNPGGSPIIDQDDGEIKISAPEVHLNGDGKRFVTWDELNTALQSHTHAAGTLAAPNGPVTGASGAPVGLDISAAKTTTIKTGG